MKLPEYFILGVPKAGTSKIADVLDNSGVYSIGCLKEPKFFTRKVNAYKLAEKDDERFYAGKPTTLQEYLRCYSGAECKNKRLVDCSTDYFRFCDRVIPQILELVGRPIFIGILRNPVERAYSQFLNNVQLDREALTLKDAVLHEKERIRSGWGPAFHYIQDGRYAQALRWFKDNRVDVKIYIYEEIFSGQPAFSQFLLDAFGEGVNGELRGKVNDSGHPIPYIYKGLRALWKSLPVDFRSSVPLQSAKQRGRSILLRKKKTLTREERDWLYEWFADDIAETIEILGRPIADWSPP